MTEELLFKLYQEFDIAVKENISEKELAERNDRFSEFINDNFFSIYLYNQENGLGGFVDEKL